MKGTKFQLILKCRVRKPYFLQYPVEFNEYSAEGTKICQNERVFSGNMYILQNLPNFDNYSAIETNLHINTRVFVENTKYLRYLWISRVSDKRNESATNSQVSTLKTVVSTISR